MILIVSGGIGTNGKLGPTEFALIAFAALFAVDFFDKIAEASFGKEGFSIQMKKVEQRQD